MPSFSNYIFVEQRRITECGERQIGQHGCLIHITVFGLNSSNTETGSCLILIWSCLEAGEPSRAKPFSVLFLWDTVKQHNKNLGDYCNEKIKMLCLADLLRLCPGVLVFQQSLRSLDLVIKWHTRLHGDIFYINVIFKQ